VFQGKEVDQFLKKGRVKVGLSLDGRSNSVLSELAKQTGDTKSKIVEDALEYFFK
jgi:predicted DNA-binding protein